MPIYINRSGQQSGPYEDDDVIDQLRSGAASPNDLGIRQGESSWRPLAELFPGIASAGSVRADASAPPAAKKGGCLKAGLITAGLLIFFLGLFAAIGSRFIPSVSCDLAQSDEESISRLQRELDKAKGDGKFDRISVIQQQLSDKLAGAEVSRKNC